VSASATYRNALPIGTTLLEYRIESVLGAGGFGMTYLCTDTNLDKKVAIKEYFPSDLALRALDGGVVPVNTDSDLDYQWGLERFIQEARTLAKFSHPHIVRVNRYFEANATGYMVMDYENGESFNELLKREPKISEARLKEIIVPLLEGLQAVHETGFLHRDIKPANIYIRTNGSPVLLDFGAARQAVSGSTKSLTAVLTPGYAPLEQYAGDGNQGPWSDIYAMAGVLFRAFTNENPPDAVSRLRKDTVPGKLAQLKGHVSEPALRAVDWALTLDEKLRPTSVDVWKRALQGKATVPLLTQSVAAPPTGAAAATKLAPQAAGAPVALRTTIRTLPRHEEPSSGWRWIGIGLALLVALMGGRAWYTQREASAAAKLEQARADLERRAQELRQADQSRLAEREAQLQVQERNAAEREDAARRAADRDEALRRLDEERAARERIVAAGETRRPAPAEKREPPPLEKREFVTLAPPRPEDRAPEHGPPGGPPGGFAQKIQQDFRFMDANGDGFLTPDEVRGRGPLERDFARADANGDGRISLQELMDFRPLKPPPKFK
jgi:serine/threonine protein kinase